MRAFTLALSVIVAVLCCPPVQAQVPKFTIISITTDPPGPHEPGTKFKIKVNVRNDGDTIPAGRRFDFVFSTANALAIGQPTGTPALFFGYCPGSTPINVVCQCFAAWEKGQTVEMETEVTIGSTAFGPMTVTFQVRSGSVSETATAAVHVIFRGPDLIVYSNDVPVGPQRRGGAKCFDTFLWNVGNLPTQGPFTLKIEPSGGVSFFRNESLGVMTLSGSFSIPAVEMRRFGAGCFGFESVGLQAVYLTVSGGGDLNPSNNLLTIQFEVIREDPDPLNRLSVTNKLAEILGR